MKFKIILLQLIVAAAINAQNLTDFQIFEIDPKVDTLLYTDLGTQIGVQKLAFENNTGELIQDDLVTIKLKEIVDQKDMVMNGITTATDEQILVSNGMILIEGYVNDEKIVIRKQTPIKVRIPTAEGSANMSIFTLVDSTQTWQKTDIKVELEPCQNYMEQIIMRDKQVTKKEYKRWLNKEGRSTKPLTNQNIPTDSLQRLNAAIRNTSSLLPELIVGGEQFDRLFGGSNVTRRSIFRKKSYFIDVPVDTVWTCGNDEAAYYNFDVLSFGWYNIDKFKVIRYPKNITITTNEDLDIYLIFPNANVCLTAVKNGKNKYKFFEVPGKKRATIVAYRRNSFNTVNFLSEKIHTNTQTFELKPSREISIGEFKRKMKLMSL